MVRKREKTLAFFQRAERVMPFGVSSNFRWWGEGTDVTVARAEGAYIYDMDGNRYIDYRLAFGPILLGHGYPPVVERVTEAIKNGTVFALTHEYEVRVAEKMVQMCPGFANSGTEATMHALRIARSHTGREKVIKFEGCYHGMYDYMLFSTASSSPCSLGHRRSPIPSQVTSGIPECIRGLVYTLPYNDFETLERVVKRDWGDIAAIIIEPIMGNAASIMPQPGWLEHVRKLCDIVMIMDEVKTGFRIAPGGAQEVFGVLPDLATYAKAMGNGFPVAAIGGKREVMESVGPGRTAQGGTYCGNVVGTAAADAVLDILQDRNIYETMEKRGKRLQEGLSRILTDAAIPHHIMGPPAMFGIALCEEEPTDYRAWAESDNALYEEIMMALIERGAMPDPDGREPWFFSYAHSEQDVDDTLNYFEDAVRAVKSG